MEDTVRDDIQWLEHYRHRSVDLQPIPAAAAVVAVRFAAEARWQHLQEVPERDVFDDGAAVAHLPTIADMSARSCGDSFSLLFLLN
jgi:hypothetical protein